MLETRITIPTYDQLDRPDPKTGPVLFADAVKGGVNLTLCPRGDPNAPSVKFAITLDTLAYVLEIARAAQ